MKIWKSSCRLYNSEPEPMDKFGLFFLYFNFPLNKATTVSFKLMILSFAMLNCIVTWLTSIIVICLNPSIFYIYNTKRFWNFLNIQAPTIKVPNENNKQYKYSSGVGDTPSIKIILINFI